MNRKILLVDDEKVLLDSFHKLLRRRFDVYTAVGPVEGLKAVRGPDSFAVVVSDLRMPGMDGIAFLNRVREIAPDTVRIMLTGCADVTSAAAAVNEGRVFRFLTKPCRPEAMAAALEAALKQYGLVTAERELLRGTLRGAVQVLSEALSLANPEAYGRSRRIQALVRRMAAAAEIPVTWEMELAALLSHIGCIALPRELLEKVASGAELDADERALYARHPTVGAGLLERIPRLEHVAEMIGRQNERNDVAACAGDSCIIARLLRLAVDYDMFESRGLTPAEILVRMREDLGAYDPALFAALERDAGVERAYAMRRVRIDELEIGMILEDGLVSTQGLLLLAKGTEVDASALDRMRRAAHSFDVVQPFAVRVPRRADA